MQYDDKELVYSVGIVHASALQSQAGPASTAGCPERECAKAATAGRHQGDLATKLGSLVLETARIAGISQNQVKLGEQQYSIEYT